MSRRQALVFLAVAVCLWSFGVVLVKAIHARPLVIAGIAGGVAAATQAFFLRSRPKLSEPIAVSALCYTGFMVSTISSIQLTSAANAVLLRFTSPLFAAVFGRYFFDERPERRDLPTYITAALGFALLYADGAANGEIAGIWLGLLSGVFSGGYSTTLRLRKEDGALLTAFWGNLFAFVFCMLPMVASPAISGAGFAAILVFGAACAGLGWVAFSVALPHLLPAQALALTSLELLFAPLLVVLFSGELPSLATCLGGMLIVGSLGWHARILIRRMTAGVLIPEPFFVTETSHH